MARVRVGSDPMNGASEDQGVTERFDLPGGGDEPVTLAVGGAGDQARIERGRHDGNAGGVYNRKGNPVVTRRGWFTSDRSGWAQAEARLQRSDRRPRVRAGGAEDRND